ncbi:hypothetical protein pb186bvf_011597 [Paramecium bursaria]
MLNNSQSISTLNTSIQKAKSEFQNLTTQNRSLIQQMQLDNSTLSEQLVNQKQKNQVVDNQLALQVLKLQDECTLIAQRIEIENKKQQELQSVVNSMKMEAKEINKHENTNNDNSVMKLIKQIQDYEMELQQIQLKHNEQLAQIDEEKEHLNLSRRERVIYSTVFKGIEKDAILKAREYEENIRKVEVLKEKNKYLQGQLKELQKHAQREQEQFQIDYENLFKPPGQEQSFISEKKSLSAAQVYITETSEQPPQKQTTKELVQQSQDLSTQVQELESSFNKLFKEVGLDSVEDILALVQNQEQQIQEIFNKINKINQQIDETQEDNELKEIQLAKYKEQAQQRMRGNHQRIVEEKPQKHQEVINNDQEMQQLFHSYKQIQHQLGLDLIRDFNDEKLIEKIEYIDKVLCNIYTISQLYENQKAVSPIKIQQEKRTITESEQSISASPKFSLQQDSILTQPLLNENLEVILSEVGKEKILAESRFTRDEIEKEVLNEQIKPKKLNQTKDSRQEKSSKLPSSKRSRG